MPAGAARAVQAVWEQRGPEAPPGGVAGAWGPLTSGASLQTWGVFVMFGMFVNIYEPLKQSVFDWCQS